MAPIYTTDNCRFSHPLSWALTLFWRAPIGNAGLVPAPHLPKAWRRHFAIRSVGKVRRGIAQDYVASQLGHHPMADSRVQQRFEEYQISNPEIDLAARRQTSHGVFWSVLHVVLVHQERWREIREAKVQPVTDMIVKVSRAKGYQLRAAGVLPDHVHLLLGCGFEDAPSEVALCFLNNLAFAHGMEAVFQFGGFIGTVGEYDFGAMRSQTSPDPGKQDRGGHHEETH